MPKTNTFKKGYSPFKDKGRLVQGIPLILGICFTGVLFIFTHNNALSFLPIFLGLFICGVFIVKMQKAYINFRILTGDDAVFRGLLYIILGAILFTGSLLLLLVK